MRSGYAALIGRPNVGKSTLLNRLLGEKVAIVSPKPQTTRTRILGVLTKEAGQIAFFDTPGIHQAKGALNKFMVDSALHEREEEQPGEIGRRQEGPRGAPSAMGSSVASE